MADERNKLLPHAEDVIFNKPSLKELIRLIKNGTINAIWPSTLQEFTDWNNGGYRQYSKGQPLKSQKTAITIYYGDNEDAMSLGTLNLEETQNRFNTLQDQLNWYKNNIVLNNFYNNISEIYPTDDLQLSLNTTDGSINNIENVINYKDEIEDVYQSYLNKITELKNRVDNFEPVIAGTSYALTDREIKEDYEKFFPETLEEVKVLFKNSIVVPSALTDEEIQQLIIVDNQYYDFLQIENLYLKLQNIIDNINTDKYLKNYYNNNELVYDNQLSFNNLISFKDEWKTKIQEFFKSFNDFCDVYNSIANTNIKPSISLMQVPFVDYVNQVVNADKTDIYTNDFNIFFTDFIDPYSELVKIGYILINNSVDQDIEQLTEQANSYWDSCINTAKNYLIENYIDAQVYEKINYINNFLIQDFNELLLSTPVFYCPVFSLKFLTDGTIEDGEESLNFMSFLLTNMSYLNNLYTTYPFIIPEIGTFDIEYFYNTYQIFEEKMNELLTISEGKTQITLGNERFIQLYKNFENSYIDFMTKIYDLKIEETTFAPFEIDEQNNTIPTKLEMKNSIAVHQTKLNKYYDTIIDLFEKEEKTQLKYRFQLIAQDLLQRLDAVSIELSQFGSSDSLNSVLSDDFNMETIELLIERIANNNETLIDNNGLDSSENIIPYLTEDSMSIENAEKVSSNLQKIIDSGAGRANWLSNQINNINTLLRSWMPAYDSTANSHYTCIAVGSDIEFPYKIANANNQELLSDQIDASITVKVDGEYHYPLVNNVANSISESSRPGQLVSVGGLTNLFTNGKLPNMNSSIGSHQHPIFYDKTYGFIGANGVIQGEFSTETKGDIQYWKVIHDGVAGQIGLQAAKLFGAVYNDYAEYRSADAHPGRCIVEKGDGTLTLSTARLQLGANIVSDTYGFAIGETNDATCPVAVCGRVLVYPLEAKELYTPGAAVCSGPDGTISLMTREEIKEWPDAIVGYVSEIPTYDTWGTDNVPVDGRIWIKIK